MSPLSSNDYRRIKNEATKAMKEPVGSGYRVPTTRWSGYYFSHTSPGPINLNEGNDSMNTPEKGWNRTELTRPNVVVPASPARVPSKVGGAPPASAPAGASQAPAQCRYRQLYDLLQERALSKYIDLFKRHELDLSTFASLNEADLTEIGVTAFGARRKMLLIIAELQKQASAYKGSTAPGAERKLINSPPHYNTAALSQDKW